MVAYPRLGIDAMNERVENLVLEVANCVKMYVATSVAGTIEMVRSQLINRKKSLITSCFFAPIVVNTFCARNFFAQEFRWRAMGM